MTVTLTTPTQWRLEISDSIDRSAWQRSQACPTPRAQWNSYLNQVCLDTLLPMLNAENLSSTVYPEAIGSLWELVSGTGLLVAGKRWVLVPDKNLDRALSVPQEWVDIPEWAGDYYLAIHVNSDEQWLEVWGYTTHAALKTQGDYDADDRTYDLEADSLIQDLNVLTVMQQMNAQEMTQATSSAIEIPTVDATQAENLLQRLATVDRPRLAIPVALWMACVQQSEWRQRLSALRRGDTFSIAVTNLSQWLQNSFASGWQTLESLLGPDAEAAFALRKTATLDAPVVIRRVKALRFSSRLLLLLVAIEPDTDGRVGIRIQVRSGDDDQMLPVGLMMTLRSGDGEVIQQVQARREDLAVQLQRFRCAEGTSFGVMVRSEEQSIEEQFLA